MSVANRSNVKRDRILFEGGKKAWSDQFYYARLAPLPIVNVPSHYPESVVYSPSFSTYYARVRLIFYSLLTTFEPIEVLVLNKTLPPIVINQRIK